MFIHRLALALSKTVEELLSTLSASELRDWAQFDRQAGLPDLSAQWQRAVAISVAGAAAGSTLEAIEYMPLMAWDSKPATAEDVRRAFGRG
jgi:hypothetical protein